MVRARSTGTLPKDNVSAFMSWKPERPDASKQLRARCGNENDIAREPVDPGVVSPDRTLPAQRCSMVAGKPLLIHAIESIAAARLTDIIVVSRLSPIASKSAGRRRAMGNAIHVCYRPWRRKPRRLIRRLESGFGEDLLIVRGEILRTPIVADFVARATSTQATRLPLRIEGIPAGLLLVRGPLSGEHLACNLLGLPDTAATKQAGSKYRLSQRASLDYQSLREFHRADLDAAAGRFPG